MNMKDVIDPTSAAAVAFVLPPAASAQEQLAGERRLACEALYASRLEAGPLFSPSLRRYFGINWPSWRDTVRSRLNFLNLCPAASDTSQNMPSIFVAIANGAGRCDDTIVGDPLKA